MDLQVPTSLCSCTLHLAGNDVRPLSSPSNSLLRALTFVVSAFSVRIADIDDAFISKSRGALKVNPFTAKQQFIFWGGKVNGSPLFCLQTTRRPELTPVSFLLADLFLHPSPRRPSRLLSSFNHRCDRLFPSLGLRLLVRVGDHLPGSSSVLVSPRVNRSLTPFFHRSGFPCHF